MVAAPDAAGEEGVAREEDAVGLRIEADAALRVAGRGDDFQRRVAEPDDVAVGDIGEFTPEGRADQAQALAPLLAAHDLLPVGRVHQNGNLVLAGHFVEREHVVEMAVGQQDLDRFELPLFNEVVEALPLPVAIEAGVDDHAFFRLVPGHIAALAERIAIESLNLHNYPFKHTNLRKDVVNLRRNKNFSAVCISR